MSEIKKRERVLAFDLFRGMIIILMALDHARFFLERNQPTEMWSIAIPVYHSFLPFFTRVITHLCEPGFFFLMGVSMVFFIRSREKAQWTKGQIIKHFALRGLILILLEWILINPCWMLQGIAARGAVLSLSPEVASNTIIEMGVLSSLGLTMILCSFLSGGKKRILGLAALVSIILPVILLPKQGNLYENIHGILRILLVPGQFLGGYVTVRDVLFPWVGVALLGMLFGRYFMENRERAEKTLIISSVIALILFIVLRFLGGFGNIIPFDGESLYSFFNPVKYPPSLVYLCLTMGINGLILFLLLKGEDGLRRRNPGAVLALGRSAFFFYIVHLYIYALIGFLFPGGLKLPWIYPLWIAGLSLGIFFCLKYQKVKSKAPMGSILRFL